MPLKLSKNKFRFFMDLPLCRLKNFQSNNSITGKAGQEKDILNILPTVRFLIYKSGLAKVKHSRSLGKAPNATGVFICSEFKPNCHQKLTTSPPFS